MYRPFLIFLLSKLTYQGKAINSGGYQRNHYEQGVRQSLLREVFLKLRVEVLPLLILSDESLKGINSYILTQT